MTHSVLSALHPISFPERRTPSLNSRKVNIFHHRNVCGKAIGAIEESPKNRRV